MITLATALTYRVKRVDLVLADLSGPLISNVSSETNIVHLGASRVSSAALALSQYLRSKRPDSLLSCMTHTNVISVIARFLSGTDVRLILSERTDIYMASQASRNLSSRVVYALVPLLYPAANRICAVSNQAARSLEMFASLPPFSVAVVYGPFDFLRIRSLSNAELDDYWLSIDDSPIIVAVGRLSAEKNFAGLITAYAESRSRYGARLLILGEGPDRQNLETLATDLGLSSRDFHMPGFTVNPYAYLSKSAVFVLNSHFEGFPVALIEAMYCNLSIISTDCPSGPSEILEAGQWGILVPPGDTNSLSNAIDDVLINQHLRNVQTSTRCKSFDLNTSVQSFLNLFNC